MCDKIGKCILIIVNVLFILISLILIIVGALLQWGTKEIKDSIIPGISSLSGQNNTLTFKMIAEITEGYVAILGDGGLIIFIIGIILLIISFSGFIGTCCSNKFFLIIYIILTTIIFLLIIIFIIVFLVKRNELKESGRLYFEKKLKDYQFRDNFKNTGSSGLNITGIIDTIQINLQCCGVNNFTDYSSMTPAERKFKTVPESCCKLTSDFKPQDPTCPTVPTTVNSYAFTGCYNKLWDIIERYSNYCGYALIGLACFLFVLIIIAGVLIRSLDNSKEYA